LARRLPWRPVGTGKTCRKPYCKKSVRNRRCIFRVSLLINLAISLRFKEADISEIGIYKSAARSQYYQDCSSRPRILSRITISCSRMPWWVLIGKNALCSLFAFCEQRTISYRLSENFKRMAIVYQL
jgi:hypothetical protein